MQKRTQIPDYPRYVFARKRAYRLLCEPEIDRLPVDPWMVAAALPNVHICKWTVLRDNCMEELRLLKSGKKLPFPIKEEDVLHRLFFCFINEFNGTEIFMMEYDDLEIDEKFDDYIECDDWGFTLMAIRKWKLEKELYAALEGSLALYDYEDMAVFVKDAGKVDFVAKNEDIILETLKKYSDSCIKRISAYAVKQRTEAE